ncbi:hypothetical protein S40293_03201 [Stachybotrys chartarum IBT 40293]|nr:hypothetical protein S40293_03201 [Stachybotrys chartarum IBT 40293]
MISIINYTAFWKNYKKNTTNMSTDVSQAGKDSPVIVGNNPGMYYISQSARVLASCILYRKQLPANFRLEDSQNSQNVPRSALGTVSESGEILDDAGKAVGKVGDSKNTQELVGNTVNTTGEVVSSTGEVLGKAIVGDDNDEDDTDYTTKPKDQEASNTSSNFSLVDNAKGAVSSGLGLVGGNKQNDDQQQPLEAEKPQTKSETQFDPEDQEHDTPVDLKDNDTPVDQAKEDVQDATKETPADQPELGDKQAVPEEAQDVQQDAEDAKDDLKEVPPQAEGEAEDLKDAADKDVPKDVPDAEDTVEEGKDKVDDKTEETQDAAEEAKDTAEGAKDNLADNAEVPKAEDDKSPEDLKENAPVDKDLPEGEQEAGEKVPGDDQGDDEKNPKDALAAGQEVAEDTTGDAKDAVEDKAAEGEETAQNATAECQEAAGDKTAEGEELAKDKTAEGEEAAQDNTAEGQEAVDDTAAETQEGVEDKTADGEELAKDKTAEGEEAVEEKAEDAQDKVDETAEEAGEQADDAAEKLDFSILKGTKVNKAGNLVNQNGDIIGRVVEGDAKKLLGKRSDENGDIWDDAGKKCGKAEPLPDSERENTKAFATFENFPDAVVEADGKVTSEGRQVGVVVEGDPKRLKGSKVDEDGDILDRRGNVVGKAEAWDEPEPVPEEPEAVVDRSALAGKRVNKAGNVVDGNGVIYGRIIEGNLASMIGRMSDKEGNIRSESGDILGKAELVPEGEREGAKEGPFAELSGLTVSKDGKVVTPSGDVVGRLTSGDAKKLSGRSVDEDGDVVDRNGNVLGKAERWEEPEEPVVEKKKDPLAGRKVNREGNVTDEDGNIIGKLVTGDLAICSGKEIDDDGDVVNSKGHTIGHVSRLEDIPPEPEAEPEETAEEKKAREEQEEAAKAAEKDKKLAGQLGYVVEEALGKVKPLCSKMTEKIEAVERQPKEERDEEELVKQVRPLIEDASKILTETNGAIRGMDPDGRIQRNAKQKAASREASPEEHHLAEVLKELTGTVTTTIDSCKRKIADMPHAKKELNPLWGLLSEPLFQILAAVGLLLNGVLGLVGRLLSGLGLGGLVDSLLGGLGLNKILDGLGLGQVVGSLTGKKDGGKKGGLLGL